MAYAETQEQEATSIWLQYHLGQSSGYRELSRRLQKRNTEFSSVPIRNSSQTDADVFAGYQSLIPIAPTCRVARSARAASGRHVIKSGEFFWLQKDRPNVTAKRKSSANRQDSLPGIQTRKCTPANGPPRACRSAASRLLGTTRSDVSHGSTARRNTCHVSRCSSDRSHPVDVIDLDVGRTKLMVAGELAVTKPTGTSRPTSNGRYTSKNIESVTRGYQDIIISYRLRASGVNNGQGQVGSPEGRNSPETKIKPDPHQYNLRKNDTSVKVRHPSPEQNTGARLSDDIEKERPEVDKVTETNDVAASEGQAKEEQSINSDKKPPSSYESTSGVPSSLTLSDYFGLSLDSLQKDNVVQSLKYTSCSKEAPSELTPDSHFTERPNTKRSVRFSVENDVYRYSPWEPINEKYKHSDVIDM